MKWITRRGVKVDRVASLWLIRKFVAHAEFVFLRAADSPFHPPHPAGKGLRWVAPGFSARSA